jgi:hypothetical protein
MDEELKVVIPKEETNPEAFKAQYSNVKNVVFVNEDENNPVIPEEPEIPEEIPEEKKEEEKPVIPEKKVEEVPKEKLFDFSRFGLKDETELQNLIKEHKELKNKKPEESLIDDEELLKLNILKKQNPEEYPIYKRLVMGNLSDFDKIKLDLKKNHPNLTDERIDLLVADKYEALFEEDADKDSKEYKLAETKMILDSEKATENLMKGFNDIKLPEKRKPEDIEKENQQLADSWKVPFQTEILPGLKSIKIENKDLGDVEVPLSDETSDIIATSLAESALSRGLKPDSDSLGELKEIARNMAIALQFEDISKALVEKNDAKWKKYIEENYKGTVELGGKKAAETKKPNPNEEEMSRARSDMKKQGLIS